MNALHLHLKEKISMQISNLFITEIILQKHVVMMSWCEDMATCETNCFLFYKDADGCGDFKREGELVPLSECNADISAHLRRFHLSKECLTERQVYFGGEGGEWGVRVRGEDDNK